jgi:hypothetical protein
MASQFGDERLLERLLPFEVGYRIAAVRLELFVVTERPKVQDGRSGVTTTEFTCVYRIILF